MCFDSLQKFSGNVIILSGDVPLINVLTLKKLIEIKNETSARASVLTANINIPDGYGRIIRDDSGFLKKIVEHKDCNDEELLINEINAGIYIFDINTLFSKLSKIKSDNSQGEYYLGDVLKYIDKDKISIFKTSNQSEILGINNVEQLNEIIEKDIN